VAQLCSKDRALILAAAANHSFSVINEGMDGRHLKRRKLIHDRHNEEQVMHSFDETTSPSDGTEFLKPQHEDVVRQCIVNFIDRTGNDALANTVCIGTVDWGVGSHDTFHGIC
jgi:hypothetical protein